MEKEFKVPQELTEVRILFEHFTLKMNAYFEKCRQDKIPIEDAVENFDVDIDALSTTLDGILGNTLTDFARKEVGHE